MIPVYTNQGDAWRTKSNLENFDIMFMPIYSRIWFDDASPTSVLDAQCEKILKTFLGNLNFLFRKIFSRHFFENYYCVSPAIWKKSQMQIFYFSKSIHKSSPITELIRNVFYWSFFSTQCFKRQRLRDGTRGNSHIILTISLNSMLD